MKRFNHGLIVGFAVLLLAAVFFVGCESPVDGVNGENGKDGRDGLDLTGGGGASAADLAAYGFAFGTPVHNVVGRDDSGYPTAIYGNDDAFAAASLTAAEATTLLAANDEITVIYGKKSVRFVLSTATRGAFVSEFNTAITKGSLGAISASLVPYAGDSANYVIKVVAPSNEKLTIISSSSDSAKDIFGTNASSGFTYNVSGDLTTTPIVDSRADKWTVPIVTSVSTDSTAASSTVTLGSKSVNVPQATPFTNFGTQFGAGLGGAVTGYSATVSATGIVFTAAVGASTNVPADFVPTIGNYAKTDITKWGYGISVDHTSTYAAPVTYTAAVDAAEIYTGAITQSTTTGGAAVGDVISITYNGYTDTTVLALRTPGPVLTGTLAAALINTTLTEAEITVPGAILATVPTTASTYKVGEQISVTDNTGANGFFGAGSRANASTPQVGTPGKPDVWTITVIGGGAVTDLIPTAASRITLTPTGVGSAKVAVIEAGDLNAAIITKLGTAITAATLPNYSAGGGGSVITLTNTTAGTLTGLTVTPGDQY